MYGFNFITLLCKNKIIKLDFLLYLHFTKVTRFYASTSKNDSTLI